MSTALGWAVINDTGEILINTVSATRRAAIVNFLMIERRLMARYDTTDEEIELTWEATKGAAKVESVRISYP